MTLQKNVSLKQISNFKIGGNTKYFVEVKNTDELTPALKKWHEIIKDLKEEELKMFILGKGTNVVFSDDDFKGLVIKNSIVSISKLGDTITVGAGTLFSDLLEYCINNSLSGLEWAGGLPGTVGGAVRGNAGAYNGETKDRIIEVESVDLETLEKIKRDKARLGFDYRTSIFKKSSQNEIITYVKFKLINSKDYPIQKLIQEKIEARKLKHPLEYPNVGSIFKNVPVEQFSKEQLNELSKYIKQDPFPVIPTAKLVFLAGLSGKRVGDVKVSEKHTNFIINLGNGKAKDVKELMKYIKKEIYNKFNVTLEPEVMFVD